MAKVNLLIDRDTILNAVSFDDFCLHFKTQLEAAFAKRVKEIQDEIAEDLQEMSNMIIENEKRISLVLQEANQEKFKNKSMSELMKVFHDCTTQKPDAN